ncbi:hypothetical protein RUM43_011938 [Polyplax serrata]|uniref:TOG domain-containing protein n=1 Tax=Polyplax serrata TaxID=468196 RepID=A0AAN8P1S8_POLSC
MSCRYEEDGFKPIERKFVKPLQAKKPPSASLTATPGAPAGAVDEEFFANAFEDVPTVQIFSAHELKEIINTIATTIGNPEMDWDKRVDAFKRIRSLLIAGAAGYDDFNELIKKWELPFGESLKDLRSHVVRETCVTIAYLAQNLGMKFARFAEVVFQNLINLIQSSAKVIASAACTCIRFIIQNVHNSRLLPIINNNLSSRSKEIRKAMCDVLDHLLHTWPLHILDKRVPLLQEAVKRGVSDADMEARISARRAYWAFKGYFPEQADALLSTLDYAYKKNLYGEVSLSGSNNSLNHGSLSRQISAPGRSRIPSSATGSAENLHQGFHPPYQQLHRTPSLNRTNRSGIPVKTQEEERSLSLDNRRSPRQFILGIQEDDGGASPNTSSLPKDHLERVRSADSVKVSCGSTPTGLAREPQKRKRLKTGKSTWEVGKKKAMWGNSNWTGSFQSEVISDDVGLIAETETLHVGRGNVTLNRSSSSFSLLGAEVVGQMDVSSRRSSCKDDFQGAVGDFAVAMDVENITPVDVALKRADKMLEGGFAGHPTIPQISGSRRLDKIRWKSMGQRKVSFMRDVETMTDLTGPLENSNSEASFDFSNDSNSLKKCPKTTNLYGGRKRSSELPGNNDVSGTSVDTEWSSSKKFRIPETTDSSKSLTFLFRSNSWFYGPESDSEEPNDNQTFPQKMVLV